jgi:hypothetical protein
MNENKILESVLLQFEGTKRRNINARTNTNENENMYLQDGTGLFERRSKKNIVKT